jgi:cyclopropane-fatty-acyl-phospholipid synthase
MASRPGDGAGGGGVAAAFAPLLDALFGGPPPVRFQFWDGTAAGPEGGPALVRVRSADALRRLVWAPGELGFGRAFACGDLDVEGDVSWVLKRLAATVPSSQRLGPRALAAALAAAGRLGALAPPLPPPPEEVRPRGLRHSRGRDARVVRHHYDVGNDFHRLVLGPSMTYSCARFSREGMSLEEAQASKHELICRKLGLHEHGGQRLLDVGCGWGSMAIHAAAHHDARVVGITLSDAQAGLGRKLAVDAGVGDRVEIRVQDYRDVRDGPFDAISSIGMFEHVGRARTAQYFETLRGLLRPRGRLLNHAISSPRGSRLRRRSFMYRYVFPDSELPPVGEVVLAMERAGFEVRDVESLREHYARTLHDWFDNLVARWDEAVALVGLRRARVWWVYLAGCANSFEEGGLGVHQVLGVVPDAEGLSGMPSTRAGWD